ncbi:MAG: Gldg family protein [Clostridia bacterium]|nr:Gldg family protein [Clostridia bacterium]
MRIIKGKSKRSLIFYAITAALVLILLCANILFTYFGAIYSSYIDLTDEGLYTLTDKMIEECAFVDELGKNDGDKAVEITFCTDPDYLTEAEVTRATYFMALKLQEEFENIKVKCVNVAANPTELSRFRTTSLTTFAASDIIVSYGDRYRRISADNFWYIDEEVKLYNGEYTLATLIKSVTAVEQPAAYFIVGHGETVYNPADPENPAGLAGARLYDLVRDQGLRVELLDLSKVNSVPSDCVLLVLNNPRTDFDIDAASVGSMSYESDIEKIEKYLMNDQGALVVARDYDAGLDLENLDNFLAAWGFEFGTSVVTDTENCTARGEDSVISSYITDADTFANQIYKEYASLDTSPKAVFNNSGYIKTNYIENNLKSEPGGGNTIREYASFLTTSDKATAYFKDENGNITKDKDIGGVMDLAGVTSRRTIDQDSAEKTHSFVFCAASGEFFSNELLANDSYANYEVMGALLNTITRIDVFASMELGGITMNSTSSGGKQVFEENLYEDDYQVIDYTKLESVGTKSGISNSEKGWYLALFLALPTILFAIGAVVCIRRRFL